MSRLGGDVGDMVEVAGKRATVCKLLPTFKEHRGKGQLHIDGIVRQNAGVGLDEPAVIRRVSVKPAAEVVLDPQGHAPSNRDLEYIGTLLDGLPVVSGDRVRATLFGSRYVDFLVQSSKPEGPVVIASESLLKITKTRKGERPPGEALPALSYEDIEGFELRREHLHKAIEEIDRQTGQVRHV